MIQEIAQHVRRTRPWISHIMESFPLAPLGSCSTVYQEHNCNPDARTNHYLEIKAMFCKDIV